MESFATQAGYVHISSQLVSILLTSTDWEVGSVAKLIGRHHGRGVTMERHTTTFFVIALAVAK